MGPICCTQTAVRNYHYSLPNNREEHSFLLSYSLSPPPPPPPYISPPTASQTPSLLDGLEAQACFEFRINFRNYTYLLIYSTEQSSS